MLALDKDFKSSRIPFERVEITPVQAADWEKARAATRWSAPGFSFLIYKMLNPSRDSRVALFTDAVPTAATDDFQIAVNPSYFFKFPLQKQVFIIVHEVLHAVFKHCTQFHLYNTRGVIHCPGGELPFIFEVANYAADYIINDMLVAARIGEIDPSWLHNPQLVDRKMNLVTAYEKVFKDAQKQGKIKKGTLDGYIGRSHGGGKGERFDDHMKPGQSMGKDPGEAATERQQRDVEWRIALKAAMSMGRMHADIERSIKEFIEPKVDWTEQITGLLMRRIGSGGYDFRRADRRLIIRDIYAPGKSGYGCDTIIVAIDTSGSITQWMFDIFFGEIRGIIDDLRPRRVIVLWCDAKVHGHQDVYDTADIDTLRPKGGGGTSFVPVFDWIEEEDITPDALVYLTDLYGTFPDAAPNYPVIWARTNDQEPPFGDVVDVPIKERR